MINDFFQQTYFQNRVIDYLIALFIFVVLVIAVRILKSLLLKIIKGWAKKDKSRIGENFVKAFEERLKPFLNLLYFGAFYFSIKQLTMNPEVERFFNIFVTILLTIFGVRFLTSLISYSLEMYWVKREKDESKKQVLKSIIAIFRLFLWSIVLIILLDNLGIKISALVTGLGIVGIAIALAAQNILGDLFSYFSIIFDRPFQIGDFIVIGDYKGTVDYIGIKTTRLIGLGGEQIIFSNKDLTNSIIRNNKRMHRRRAVFQFGVTYQTSLIQLKKIPVLVEEIISKIPDTTFDRAHFYSYGDFSLNFEIVYYVHDRDYKKYMDIQQEINFRLKEIFEQEGIEFAYPTQTIFLSRENNQID